MRELRVSPRDLGDYAPLVPLRSEGDGYDVLVSESVKLVLDGKVVAIFNNDLGERADQLLQVLRSIRYHRSQRAEGLESNSRTFGYLPRVTIRRDFCTATALMTESPRAGEILLEWASIASRLWAEQDPDGYRAQRQLLNEKVLDDWRLPGGAFTSGICNYNNPLRFHYDKGNFPGTWSAMFAFTHNVKGGHLVLPGYRVAFRFHRPSFIIFDGQKNLHGVSPIKYIGKGGFRYSVVYYAMQAMCRCLSAPEELERIRVVKTQRENRRAGVVK